MKVKVGNTIYDGRLEPIMVILSKADKLNIAHMSDSNTRYAAFPGDSKMTVAEKLRWMRKR